MSEEISVRRARPDEIESAARLAGKLVRMHHEVDPGRFFLTENVEQGYAWWFGKEIERSAAVILVAVEGESLVGYAYGAFEDRDWNLLLDEHGALHDLYVVESVRQRGVGRRLVEAMIAELEALGARRIVLGTMVQNQAAQRLFGACGFRPTLLEMTRGG
jgi:ribosomal protein S18 acetylase RimI-like enzyme